MKNIILTEARKDWLATFFQHAALLILAGMFGGEFFLKLSLSWRLAAVSALVICFALGFLAATNSAKKEK